MDRDLIINSLEILDERAGLKNIRKDFIICGGASLILQGIVSRSTKDIDIIEPSIPEELKEDIFQISELNGLDHEWINLGPESIIRDLSDGWKTRVFPVFEGQNITIYSLGRIDILFTKFWAMCDRQQDLFDIIALKPTLKECEEISLKVKNCDQNPHWKDWVDENLESLKRELGYE